MQMSGKHLLPLVLGSLLLASAGCKGSPPAETGTLPPLPTAEVKVLTAQEQPARHENAVTGTVESTRRTTIAAKISGTIEKMPVTLGSKVKAGDLLIQIRAAEIDARLAQAQAQMNQAQRDFAREKRLLEKEAASPETVKSFETAYLVAEAAYAEVRTMQSYKTLVAPFTGVISMKAVQVGDLASPGTPLLILEDNRQLQVVVQIPEALALQTKTNDRLAIRFTGTSLDLEGKVAEIAPAADPRSRTTTVKLAIDSFASLRPGQEALVFLPGTAVNTLLVPATAISRYGQMERIFLVHNGFAQLRLVRTGEIYDNQIEVLSGLSAGEQVVIESTNRLLDGQPLLIQP